MCVMCIWNRRSCTSHWITNIKHKFGSKIYKPDEVYKLPLKRKKRCKQDLVKIKQTMEISTIQNTHTTGELTGTE